MYLFNIRYKQSIQLFFPIIAIFFLIGLDSCKKKKKEKEENVISTQTTPDNGTLHISVDETFRPVIDQEIEMYHATYPNAHIIADYKPEVDCFKDFQNDTSRLIIVARGLDSSESNFYKAQLGAVPRYEIVAFDAVAVLVNRQSPDSLFSYEQLQDILTGKESNKTVAVDGSKATSTVRYLIDSILKGKEFGSNIIATSGSKEVLNYVTNNVNAIGFIGYSWMAAIQDSTNSYYNSKIKTALIKCKTCKENNMYARPSQENITNMRYSMFRPVVSIIKDRDPSLATGFYNFLQSERGQLIFRRALLMPAMVAFNVRQVNLK
ncbi:MAG: hypothetical protein DI598_10205 [Pseudopedobacter saltans]|uniref:PBP domain-containing protein n=1 Tax=Pseudopedobacter saltans TaxID=151895 RepID=A0A2W5EYA0_9SPHI|nr:MAG: hypothetical protein DI598_10205 [Pseudopedobacter saltans]